MGRKSNTPFELKIVTVEAYERNEGSIKTISERFCVSARALREWVQIYRSQGKERVLPSNTNKHWSKDIKLLVVREYLSGGCSLQDLCRKYKISSTSILRNWIKVYNDSHKELLNEEKSYSIAYLCDKLKVSRAAYYNTKNYAGFRIVLCNQTKE